MLTTFWSSIAFAQNVQLSSQGKKLNKFSEIKIKILKPDTQLQCHSIDTHDRQWSSIDFNDLPQNEHFCMRAWIEIDKSLLSTSLSLLVAMSGSSEFYWDGSLISQNGSVGHSFNTESPGTIKTLVRISKQGLTSGMHLLAGSDQSQIK